MNEFKFLANRLITNLVPFLAISYFANSCNIRSHQSETMGTGDSWCSQLKDFAVKTKQSCNLKKSKENKESEVACALVSELKSNDIQCILFKTLIKEKKPTERIEILRVLPFGLRATLGKELEFLIPDDVKPRLIKPEFYVDAYIKAVERIKTLQIPIFIANPSGGMIRSALGLDDGRVAYSAAGFSGISLNIAGFNSGKLNTDTFQIPTKGIPIILFNWNSQLCMLNGTEDETMEAINCYNYPKVDSKELTKSKSFRIQLKEKYLIRPTTKIINNNIYIFSLFNSIPRSETVKNIILIKIDMDTGHYEDRTSTWKDIEKQDFMPLAPGEKILRTNDHLYLASEPMPKLNNKVYSNLTGGYILEDLFIGSTNQGLIAIEKDSDFKVLKTEKKYPNCSFAIYEFSKLTGGYLLFDYKFEKRTKTSLNGSRDKRILDIWAPRDWVHPELPIQGLMPTIDLRT